MKSTEKKKIKLYYRETGLLNLNIHLACMYLGVISVVQVVGVTDGAVLDGVVEVVSSNPLRTINIFQHLSAHPYHLQYIYFSAFIGIYIYIYIYI